MAPKQKPHRSRQDYETPWEFVHKVEKLLGIPQFYVDLAADTVNHKAPHWLDENDDSLQCNWVDMVGSDHLDEWMWLNPPYTNIGAWAEKCMREYIANGVKVALLVPARVGSDWFRDYVHNTAAVRALNGRLSFDGIGP